MYGVENVQVANNIHQVVFEQKDTQIFSIPNTKTKLSTLQNYFFPRLEILLRYTLDTVARIYNSNPYEKMAFVYCPSHRENAKENKDFGVVHMGVTAKKSKKPLRIIKNDGKPFVLHPTYLTFKVLPSGAIYVELLPFRQGVDDAYVAEISVLIRKHISILAPLLSAVHISHRSDISYCEFLPLYQAISPREIGSTGIKLISPKYYFPVNSRRGFHELILAFALLYALAESFICVGEGRKPKLEKMLEQFREWYVEFNDTANSIEEEKEKEDFNFSEIPELDSYSFVRAGKWWAVLARDKWKCLSCGRSARENGVLLEVDHIIPRSQGGMMT